MKIAFNPSTVAALITPPNNKDITFDLRGRNIFARGVKFCGTDTWRDIKINNVSIGSNILDLRNGSNTTLTNINGVVTINSTWRPVVDNLTSDSTTSSLSANQGRVLAGLIDGKSDSDHNHDDRYLRLTGGWMLGDINFGGDNKIYWGRNSDSASISFKNDGDGDADSYMSFVTSDNGNEYFRWSHSSGSTNTEWMALRSDGLRVGGTKVSLEGHSHNDLYYTKTEVNNKLNGKSDTGHTHDDRYLKLTGGIVNGVVGINATGVCSNSVLTVGPQNKGINTGIVDRYGTMLQIVGTGKKNEGGVIGFHNPGLYSAIIGFVRDTNETGFIFDTDVDRNSWYVKARAFKGNLIGDADSVDGVHMDWSTNYTAGNYLAIWDNAGNCIRPIPKGSTSVGYATSAGNSDTVDGKHASDFASAEHNHDGRYVYNYGETQMDGASINKNSLGMTTNSGITEDWWHILQAAWNGEYRWNSQIAFPTQNRNGMYYRSGLDDNTAWGAWVKLLDTNNYSSVLDIRYITDITTSVNKLTFTKNGSNIARDITVNNIQSLGRRNPLTERNAISGIYTYGTYSATDNLAPTDYFETLGFGEGAYGTIEIGGSWISGGKLYWRALRDCCEDWFSWKTILDSSNYSGILDSRYYTESEVNSLLDAKLNRQNLSYGTWNPRGYNLAADYCYNGGDLSISESGGKIHISVDGYFWQNEGQYRVLDTSDVAGLKNNLTVHQYLSNTDTTWWPLIWGGNSHNNTSDSTGEVYKSYDKLSWQTSSQTLYATNIQTNNIKNLSVGGGIYWNPWVESTTDNTDSASITLVKTGVAGGTTLVLSQMNDTNDTIQFQTNGSARLYHNSYPILTTQNTYVSSNKGYINNTEITQVNNADTVDGYHANGLLTALSNSNNGISITVGGTTKSISNISVNYASSAGSVAWDNVTGKPSTFAPSAHTHKWADITDHITKLSQLTNDTGFVTGSVSGNTITINGSSTTWSDTWRPITDDYKLGESGTSLSSLGSLTLYNDLLNSISNPTNYYWANVKISTSSSTTTSPTVSNLTATSSIKMSNISLEHTNEINNGANGSIYLNYRNSGNVSLCVGGGNVGIGAISPSHKLHVMGNTFTKGFGIIPYYLSDSNILPTISPGDGYTYRCLEIGKSSVVSCIIADRVALSNERGVLIKFNTGYDGQIVLLKDLQNYGSGNGYFWVMPSGCAIIRPDGSSTEVSYNQISNVYDDGKSRFFVYSSKHNRWIEFYCG